MNIWFISDLHITSDPNGCLRGVNVRRNADRVFRYLKSVETDGGMDLLVLGGDVSHDGSAASYAYVTDWLARLHVPYEAIPGNHDIDGDLPLCSFNSLPKSLNLDSTWMLHLIDSRLPNEEFGHLDEATLTYLKEQMTVQHASHIIALHHDIFQSEAGARPGIPQGPQELLILLCTANTKEKLTFRTPGHFVDLRLRRSLARCRREFSPETNIPINIKQAIVISGHRHCYSAVRFGSIYFINSGAVSCQFGFLREKPELTSRVPEVLQVSQNKNENFRIERHVLGEEV